MSTIKVNNIESYTPGNPLNVNDELQITGSSATGAKSFSHGLKTTASGDFSHAEGDRSKASSGSYAHAEGTLTDAKGIGTHAEGYQTVALGAQSHAEGYYTVTSQSGAHAEGYRTSTDSRYQHVQGHWNATSSGSNGFYGGAYMVIGNGSNSSNRRNLAEFHRRAFIFDTGSIPTSDPGVLGQLYRTGSNRDEIKISFG